MHEIVCIFPAPIPVGHRVEVSWFTEEVQGILTGPRMHTYLHEPLIKDLDTGIEYASHQAYESSGGKAHREPLRIGPSPNPGVTISHRLVGVVRRCRVIACVGYQGDPLQTHIEVEPLPADQS